MKEQRALSAPVTETVKPETRTTEQIVTHALDHAQAERYRRWRNVTDISLGVGLTGVALTLISTSFGGPTPESAGWAITKLAGVTMGIMGVVGGLTGIIGQEVDKPRRPKVARAHA